MSSLFACFLKASGWWRGEPKNTDGIGAANSQQPKRIEGPPESWAIRSSQMPRNRIPLSNAPHTGEQRKQTCTKEMVIGSEEEGSQLWTT
jgi:hypothetical protein